MMTLLMLLVSAVGAKAQHWTESHSGEGHATETVVYANLDLGSPSMTPIYGNYQVAAFVDGEVRAIATANRDASSGEFLNFFSLVVKGNYDQAGTEDDGKTITFKLYNMSSGVEYDLTSAAITFDGQMHGTLNNPFALSTVEIEMLMLSDIEINKGETIDLTTLVTTEPANATLPNNITWSVEGYENYLSVTADGKLTANAVGENLWLTYSFGSNGSPKSVMVTVKNPATAINVKQGYETIIVNVGDEATLTQRLSEAIEMTPADATDRVTWTSSNESVVAENMTNGNWNPLSSGEATLTASVVGNPGLTAKLVVRVVAQLTAIRCTMNSPMIAGTTDQIVVTPVPADAELDLNSLSWELTGSSLPDGWTLIDVASVSKNNEGEVIYTIDVENPGSANFRVMYDDGVIQVNSDPQAVNVGVALALESGWQWMTLWKDIESENMTKAFGDNLVEIRSQVGVMANDATYGYFGPLADNGLMANNAYKVNMSADVPWRDAYVMENGTYLARPTVQTLQKGWTWIPYPYYHSYPLSAFKIDGTAGDRIVSFNDGFAEYDGTNWTGTLTELNPRQAYLYYNNSSEGSSFTWTEEPVVFSSNPRLPAPRRRMASQKQGEGVWQYDASQFSDNMSIVAACPSVDEAWTVGAFVGDECRGEGRMIEGKFFITVHADEGEDIHFRLHNSMTGEMREVTEHVSMSLMLGSLSAPFPLTTKGGIVTGISSADDDIRKTDDCYDLSGRRVKANSKGIYIVNGKKIVK